jgi:hypothetical protein
LSQFTYSAVADHEDRSAADDLEPDIHGVKTPADGGTDSADVI